MAAWIGSQGFGVAPRTGIDLGGITASVATHAIVLGLLALTWGEDTQVEGGTRAALVTFDVAAPEGGPGPKLKSIEIQEKHKFAPSKAKPKDTEKQRITLRPKPEPQPSPSASPAKLAGGGEGRTGTGHGVAPVQTDGMAKLVPVNAVVATRTPVSVVAFAPQSAGSLTDAEAREGSGGTGGGRSDQAGNSAVSDFKGRIYQHLLRHRRTNTIGSGDVLVRFTVLPDGNAQNISIARSAGVQRFDQEALKLVRRAAPFPRPPDGAAHTFTFAITGQ